MTVDVFASFSPCLRYRSPGNAPAWDDGCALYYFAALAEIPDADAPLVMKAIMTGGCGKFRPDPDEVLALWRKITRPAPVVAEELAGLMLLKRREKGMYQRRIPDDPYNRWETCEPPWGEHQQLERRVSLGMGGWTAFCSDDSPLGVLRGQLVKLAAAVIGGANDEAISALRLEYQAANPPPALPVPDLCEPPRFLIAQDEAELSATVRMGDGGRGMATFGDVVAAVTRRVDRAEETASA